MSDNIFFCLISCHGTASFGFIPSGVRKLSKFEAYEKFLADMENVICNDYGMCFEYSTSISVRGYSEFFVLFDFLFVFW